MTYTQFSAGNVALLILGGIICCVSVFFSVMTGGFGADPVNDFSSLAFATYLFLSLLLVPIYLLMFRWCRVGAVAMWCLFSGCAIILFAGFFFERIAFLIPLFIEALIFEGINSRSCTEPNLENGQS
jgi:DMSO/TMAO reductase YedYZ heme-binding membrane subunit